METDTESRRQEIVGPSTQTTGGTKPLHRFLRGEPRTVGIVLLFLGLCLFIFGIPLKGDVAGTSTESYSPFWLGILYFICGILYIQSERNTTKKIITISLVFTILAILGTIVGTIIFIKTLATLPLHYTMYGYFSDNETDMAMEHYKTAKTLLYRSTLCSTNIIPSTHYIKVSQSSLGPPVPELGFFPSILWLEYMPCFTCNPQLRSSPHLGLITPIRAMYLSPAMRLSHC